MIQPQESIIGKTAYWNLDIPDFCKVYDTYVRNQPLVKMSVRPSHDAGKIVVTIHIDSPVQAGFFVAAVVSVSRPQKEDVDYVLR